MGITVLAVLALVTGILSLRLGARPPGRRRPGDLRCRRHRRQRAGARRDRRSRCRRSALGVGYGFWAMKPWAWAAGLAIYCASLGMSVFAVLLAGVAACVTVAVAGRHRASRSSSTWSSPRSGVSSVADPRHSLGRGPGANRGRAMSGDPRRAASGLPAGRRR